MVSHVINLKPVIRINAISAPFFSFKIRRKIREFPERRLPKIDNCQLLDDIIRHPKRRKLKHDYLKVLRGNRPDVLRVVVLEGIDLRGHGVKIHLI